MSQFKAMLGKINKQNNFFYHRLVNIASAGYKMISPELLALGYSVETLVIRVKVVNDQGSHQDKVHKS